MHTQHIIFSRDVICSQHSMKKEKFCPYCDDKKKKFDCGLGVQNISKILTKVHHKKNNKIKTFISWESLKVLLSISALMAEVANHTVIDRINNILKNQPKTFAYFSQQKSFP